MPVFEHGSATIGYEVRGSGHPLLLLAPGGMRSAATLWAQQPGRPRPPWINPLEDVSDRFMVIGMDQRNAGSSVAPISSADGWHVYLEDQLALLDHLGLKRFHVMGGCIGSSFALGLCEVAPDRVTAAVLQNPIGLTESNRPQFQGMFDEWADAMRSTHPELDDGAATAFRERMFGGDFVFTVDRDFVRSCRTPLLVLPGGDDFHPRAVAEEIVALAPDAVLLSPWGGDEHRANTLRRIMDFLVAQTPDGA
ncbi:MAG TPA: alpha/beta fold hydrolase [Candidatus Dormibacteraeota bacterium]